MENIERKQGENREKIGRNIERKWGEIGRKQRENRENNREKIG